MNFDVRELALGQLVPLPASPEGHFQVYEVSARVGDEVSFRNLTPDETYDYFRELPDVMRRMLAERSERYVDLGPQDV